MRIAPAALVLFLLPTTSYAGELDLDLGVQATQTEWSGDRGGGPTLSAAWMFRSWIGASFLGKEHYATVDDRFMSYFSLNAVVRGHLGRVRVSGTAGLVHQHEEPRTGIDSMPLESAFGVADGIRHRMGSRTGIQLAVPIRERRKGNWYLALELDSTMFADADRGPRWMTSAGLSVGFSHDFSKASAAKPSPAVQVRR
jgi:hypothetical protein